MAFLLSRMGSFAYRRRWGVVITWVVVLLGAGVGGATLAGETSSVFSIPGQESSDAQAKIAEEFGSSATTRVVLKAPEGQLVTSAEVAARVDDLTRQLTELPQVVAVSDPFDPVAPTVDATGTVAYISITYAVDAAAITLVQRDALIDIVQGANAQSLTVEATGDALTPATHVGGPAEAVGVGVALLILALTYGSLVAAGMNMLTAVVGVAIGLLGISITSGFVDLQSTTTALAAMLGLAVGIDYALFIITRFRDELRRGLAVDTAIRTTVATAGSAVVTAGLTVVLALAGLSVVGIPFLTQMGLAAVATIVVAVLVALTLVPAVLGLIGLIGLATLRRRERTMIGTSDRTPPGQPSPPRDVYTRWIASIARHPVVTLLLAVVVLGVISIPVASMRTTLVEEPATGTMQARAEQLLSDAFGDGFSSPLVILVQGEDARHAAASAVPALAGLDDVVLVSEPVESADGTAALMTVIPESGPTSPATERLVSELRTRMDDAGGVETYVTGATAVSVDVAATLDDALPIYLMLVIGLALVLLVLVFRSVLVPLVAVAGFLLTVGSALGATVAVFQWGWLASVVNLDHTRPLVSLTPILVIGILFGLAMDYQVFLVSRMHEAHQAGASAKDAVSDGFRQAAPVVVAAALIMFAVFAGFVPDGQGPTKSIAFALAVGVATDALVVRMIVVPSALTLLGERAWWLPRWLRWLPDLNVEGTRSRPPVAPRPGIEEVAPG